jgi:AraC-like DNA-binding protein
MSLETQLSLLAPGLLRIEVGQMGVATYPPGASFGPRTLADWEFVWLIEGNAVYTRGHQTVDVPQGSVLLCRPGQSEHFQWDRVRRTRHAYLHFSVNDPYECLPPMTAWPLVRPLWSSDDLMATLFRHILTWGKSEDLELLRMDVAHLMTVFFSGQSAVGFVQREQWPEAVELACLHIHERLEANCAAPIPLAELAETVHVSAPHLCRLFKASMGKSPAKVVCLIRLERAAALLLRSNFSIREIAEVYGFANPYHFSDRFKQEFGMSPRAMRKEAHKENSSAIPKLLSLARTPVMAGKKDTEI